MNKKFEAVPVDEWIKTNPSDNYYLALAKDQPMALCYFKDERIPAFCTHVLVPIEEQWISVEDRLPENREKVLAWNGAWMRDASFEEHTEQDSSWFKTKFTHWRPSIPSPKDTEQTKEK